MKKKSVYTNISKLFTLLTNLIKHTYTHIGPIIVEYLPLSISQRYGIVKVSSVSIVTDYGLDGPGSNPGGDEIFRLSRPALETT